MPSRSAANLVINHNLSRILLNSTYSKSIENVQLQIQLIVIEWHQIYYTMFNYRLLLWSLTNCS